MMGTRRLAALLVAVAALAAAAVQAWPAPVAAASPAPAPAPTVTASASPALAQDAPDPDIVRVGSTFYAFTTGTTWGNRIGIATSTSADPRTGWSAPPGSTAIPAIPPAPWQVKDTSTSPGVFQVGGTWIMFYDAVVATPGAGQGKYCLSVATAAKVTGPYTDSSSGPLVCQ
ncbi:MAG TPA: family 43 glycosylhydrolase, partial [Mycobacteriales bacterium]